MRHLRRRLPVVGTTIALIAGSTLLASPATAAPELGPQLSAYEGEPDFTGVTTNPETDNQGGIDNATMYGAYIPSSGVLSGNRVWCIDRGLTQPMGNGYDEGGKSSVEAPELAYILAKWDEPRSDQASQMAHDMAISEHVHSSEEIDHRDILDDRSLEEVTDGIGWNEDSQNLKDIGAEKFSDDVLPDAYDLSALMGDEAAKYAGNGTYEAEVSIDADSSTATVSLVNSEGVEVPGFEGELSVDGAEAETTDITSGEEPVEVSLDFADDVPDASVSVTFSGLPTGSVTQWDPKDFDADDYDRTSLQGVIEGQETTAEASDSYQGLYTPEVSSQVSVNEITDLPATVTDKVRLDHCAPGETIDDAKVDVYAEDGTIAQSKSVPEDAELLETFTPDVTCGEDGTADFETEKLALDADFVEPGKEKSVTFVASAPASGSNEAFSHEYGVPSETVAITIPEAEKPDDHPVVKTGAYVDSTDGGPNWNLVGGIGLLTAAGALIIGALRRRTTRG
ncbi:hypothetical protein BSP239C_03452 [Brevibacterium sp. 239c]|uniref:hypothetical protein n=1 Tax=Brevibacterium sp. 239c TaxID=1965356 RepID=UPI000C369095|nr:hypothetical protein [Brevibacterium sp. 239c]SMY03073.1 hypothetical protein BSP239C_03452 [Brevibacterium sp. 239c]